MKPTLDQMQLIARETEKACQLKEILQELFHGDMNKVKKLLTKYSAKWYPETQKKKKKKSTPAK